MLALVDCDQFYVSCERVFDPKLKNKPVAVLTNNDGCIIARSPEIKAFGVKMGDPYFKVKELIENNNGLVFSSNYELYGDMSSRVMNVLRTFSIDVDVYSIDEAFIRLPIENYQKLGEEISKKILAWTGMPTKVGIANTKTLCKVAADLVKKRKIKGKCFVFDDISKIKEELKKYDVSDVWGIGSRTSEKLYKLNIKTCKELCEYPEDFIKKQFGVNLLRTVLELKETPCFTLDTIPQKKKSTCFSRSFGSSISDYEELKGSVVFYARSISENIRKSKQLATAVSVFISTNYHNKNDLQYYNSTTICLDEQSNATKDIIEASLKCLNKIYRKGYSYKKSGVILTDLIDQDMSQGFLFSQRDVKNDKLSAVMDGINNKFGTGTIKMAGEGLKDQEWKMKRGKLSKHFTTDWKDLLEVD